MAGFVDATKVAARPDGVAFDAQLDAQWTVGGRPNGGYLTAILARAAISSLDAHTHPHPLVANTHFVATPAAGPATVVTEVMRSGRTVSQVRARLEQDGRHCAESLFTLGRLDPAAEPYWTAEPPVDVAAEEECVLMPVEPPGTDLHIDMLEVVEQRLDPAGRQDGSGELRGWARFADGMAPDPVSLLFVADFFPPATLTINPSGWVPTLELTVYVRAVPAPGALRVRQRARLVEAGLVDEVCDVWDSRGRLVAQATQLASIRFTT